MGSISKAIVPATFAVSMVGQITQKDIAAYPNFTSLSNVEKGKFMLNSVVGRTTGFAPFSQYGSPGFTANPAGVINKYTGMGLGLMILSNVIPKGMGGKGISRKVGKGLFWGGIVGGFFDAPNNSANNLQNLTSYGRSINTLKRTGSAISPY